MDLTLNTVETLPLILAIARAGGYKIFTKGSYNLNLIGIRSKNRLAGRFDDSLWCFFRDYRGDWVSKSWKITTDPSDDYLKSPINSAGTAILAPGQYLGSHKIGLHRGKYKALVQAGQVKVYRDFNKDSNLDLVNPQSGLFGINIHRAHSSKEVEEIGPYSAGCQVFADPADFDEFMAIIEEAAAVWGDRFSYTLLEEPL